MIPSLQYSHEFLKGGILMKHGSLNRFLSLVCAIMLMVLCVVPALAESFNLASMTDTEIISLLEQVNQAIVTRGIQKTAKLAKGAYIAGKDIPAGSYVFTCLATGDDWGNVTVYSEGGAGKQLLWNVVSAPEEGQEPETIFITLNEGDQLKSGVAFSLTINVGVLFK